MARSSDPTRRDVAQNRGRRRRGGGHRARDCATIQRVKAASDQVSYGLIGTGEPGPVPAHAPQQDRCGRCLAVCDIYEPTCGKARRRSAATRRRISITGSCWDAGYRRGADRHAAVTSIPHHAGTPCWPASTFSARRAWCSRPRDPRATEAGRRASQADSASGTPAALQPVLPDREADGRQRAAGQGDARQRAVEPQSGLGHEAGPGAPERAELAAIPAVFRGRGGGTGLAPGGCGDWMFGSRPES